MSDEQNPSDEQKPAEQPKVKPNPARHVFLGETMVDGMKEFGSVRERRVSYGGVNFEHIDEHESGCWRYRQM